RGNGKVCFTKTKTLHSRNSIWRPPTATAVLGATRKFLAVTLRPSGRRPMIVFLLLVAVILSGRSAWAQETAAVSAVYSTVSEVHQNGRMEVFLARAGGGDKGGVYHVWLKPEGPWQLPWMQYRQQAGGLY